LVVSIAIVDLQISSSVGMQIGGIGAITSRPGIAKLGHRRYFGRRMASLRPLPESLWV
jgi:hypothetical protein